MFKLFGFSLHKIQEDFPRFFLYGRGHNSLGSLELHKGSERFGFTVDLEADNERTICLHLSLPYLLSGYLTFNCSFGYKDWWKKFLRLDHEHRYGGRSFGLEWWPSDCPELRSGSVEFRCGQFTNCARSRDPWYHRLSLTPSELIYGEITYTDKVNSTGPIKVKARIPHARNFAEEEIDLEVELYESRWDFERFKYPHSIKRATIKCNNGVRHPGKGTTAYNCEDGYLTELTCPATNVDEAVAKFVGSAVKYRIEYPL